MDQARRPQPAILIVEDDELLRKSLATFVRSLGYRVAQASSAEEALARGDLDEIDLHIVDYHLPGMSGIAFADALRARHARSPVLLMSGYLNDAIRGDALREGVVDVLHKPMDMKLLDRRIEQLLGVEDPA